MTERTDWHKFFQEVIEDSENLRELSGKLVSLKAREHQQMIRADFVCHTESDLPPDHIAADYSAILPF